MLEGFFDLIWLFFFFLTVYQNVFNMHLLKSFTCNSTSHFWREKHGSVFFYSFIFDGVY